MRHPFLTALQFLTTLPLPAREISPRELGHAVGWFPLVGLGIGAILAGTAWLLGQWLPPEVTAPLILTLWIISHGAIHFDGFLDSCDGLFGGHTPEQRLSIMRDHRVGAFAVAGGGLLLLLKYSTLTALPATTIPLLLAPTLGRWAIALAIVLFPYAREQGLGRAMKDHAGPTQALWATVLTLAVAFLIGGWRGGLTMAVAGVGMVLIASFIRRRIPGLSGDSYGAIVELTELIVLITWLLLP